MDAQLTVRLPEDLKRALDAASRRMQRKSSDVVRMALRAFLGEGAAPRGKPGDRVGYLLGSLDTGVADLAERHREYLLDALKHGE